MFDYSEYQTQLACGSVDMRKSINGLCEIVMQQFSLDPREKVIFAFCNKSRNRVKLLVWEDLSEAFCYPNIFFEFIGIT